VEKDTPKDGRLEEEIVLADEHLSDEVVQG
jgi:hypothetical protein